MSITQVHVAEDIWDDRCEPLKLNVPDPVVPDRGGCATPAFGGLLETIESQVIPRLLMLHRPESRPSPAPVARPGQDDVVELGRLVLSHHERVGFSYVEALLEEGMPLDMLYIDLLAPTARHLGELWKADLCSFAEVTLGLYRLQELLHELSPRYHGAEPRSDPGPSILLSPLPGEQHTFGLLLVQDAFVRAGWDVALVHPCSMADLGDAVRERRCGLIGISSARNDHGDMMALAVRTVRRAAGSRPIGVLVGGRPFVEDPGLALRVGADGMAADAPSAVAKAAGLLYLLHGVDTLALS